MNELQQKVVDTQLSDWAEKTKTDVNLLKKEFEEQKKTISVTFDELSEEEVINFALARLQASLKKKLLTSVGKTKYEGVFLGSEGRLVNWSDVYRTKTMKLMDGLTKEEQLAKGYVDAEGNLLYPPESNPFRKGKKIVDNEFSYFYEAVVKPLNSQDQKKIYPARIDVRIPMLNDKITLGKVFEFEATKSPKSNDDKLILRVDSGEITEKPGVLTPKDFIDSNEIAFGKKTLDYETLVTRAENITATNADDKMVTLRGLIVRSITENVGVNLTTRLDLDTPTMGGEYNTIVVWLPKINSTTLVETNPINVYGRLRGADKDRQAITLNGIAVWYDAKYLPKIAPVNIEELDKEEIAEAETSEEVSS